jgi:hypothetical protein
MAPLEFPFWIVFDEMPVQADGADSNVHTAHLFTTVDKLVEHLGRLLGRHSQIMFVERRENLLLAVADLHHCKIAELDIDPNSIGNSDSTVSVRDMLRQCHAA